MKAMGDCLRHGLVVGLAIGVGVATTPLPSAADTSPGCRLHGDGTIATGDNAAGSAHSTDFLTGLGTGVWRHITSSGDRFDGRISSLACHSNTGEVADFDGTGRFRGSDAVLTLMGHIEDRTRLAEPDFYSMAIFSGSTLVYSAIGEVGSGGFRVRVQS